MFQIELLKDTQADMQLKWTLLIADRKTLISASRFMFYWPFQGGASFVDHLCYLCIVLVKLSRLLVASLWSPAGNGLTTQLSCLWCLLWLCYFPMWCPGSGVVLDCIDSWSLPSFFRTFIFTRHADCRIISMLYLRVFFRILIILWRDQQMKTVNMIKH